MSRDLLDENYYITSGGKIPVKWTAPEVTVGFCLYSFIRFSQLRQYILESIHARVMCGVMG